MQPTPRYRITKCIILSHPADCWRVEQLWTNQTTSNWRKIGSRVYTNRDAARDAIYEHNPEAIITII